MKVLSETLTVDNILLELEVSSKKRAFEQAALQFENNMGISRSVVSDSLFSRERLGSTALGHGVAIPHGRIHDLREPLAAFLRLKDPIPFDSPDNQNVDLLMILLVPEHATQEYLELLSNLARLLSQEVVRKNLRDAQTPEEVYAILTQET